MHVDDSHMRFKWVDCRYVVETETKVPLLRVRVLGNPIE
jgi:hypothetical protein